MPSTHTSLHYRIVFSTKNRDPLFSAAQCVRLHAYLGGIIRGMDGVPHAVGGVNDHVHILAGLRATHRLSDVMWELKADSSTWIQREGQRLRGESGGASPGHVIPGGIRDAPAKGAGGIR